MNRAEAAVANFLKGYSCSQSVLSSFGLELGLDEETCFKLGAGFGGGMGRMGLICGAVTGAIMVIGMKYGHINTDDADAKMVTYELVNEFREEFEKRHGSIICKEILGCDISTPEGHEEFKRKNLIEELCPKLVRAAVEILEEIFI